MTNYNKEPIRIWIDGQCLQTPSAERGIGRYLVGLINGLNEQGFQVDISFNARLFKHFETNLSDITERISVNNIYFWESLEEQGERFTGYSDKRKASELILSHHIAKISPDLALSASSFEGFLNPAVPFLNQFGHGIQSASIFYDAIPLVFPEKYLPTEEDKKFYLRRLNGLKSSDYVWAISEFSNKQYENLTGARNSKVIYTGIDQKLLLDIREVASTPKTISDLGNFIYYIGGLDWRKNIDLVIRAFPALTSEMKRDLKFVISGKAIEPETSALKALWKSNKLDPENLIFTGEISDKHLVAYYRSALLVVQPSLMEGFGLTVLEAALCGAPIATSNAGAFSEIINNDKAVFDTENPVDLTKIIKRTYLDKTFRRSLIQQPKSSLKYEWGNIANLALENVTPNGKSLTKSEIDNVTLTHAQEISLDRKVLAAGIAIAEECHQSEARILVDVTATVREDGKSGIQRVVNKIAENIPLTTHDGIELFFLESLEPPRRVRKDRKGNFLADLSPKSGELAFQKNDTVLMLDSSWDLIHSHKRHFFGARLKGTQVYSVLYDLVPIRTPAFCHSGMPPVFSDWLLNALDFSDGFVCISKAVADNLVKFLQGINYPRPLKIGYWSLGADFKTIGGRAAATDKNKFLSVGTIEPRKGYRIIIEAFEKLWADGVDVQLTIVGRPGWNTKDLQNKFKELEKNNPNFTWFDNATDEQLKTVYGASSALITASFAEGFGLPIVEAASLGIPIIASEIEVFKEVSAGTHTTFFKVGNSLDLASKIELFMNSSTNKDIIKAKNFQAVSWKESTQQLFDIIRSEHWYTEYLPKKSAGGLQDHSKAVTQKRYDIELVEGPYEFGNSEFLTCTVKIINKSKVAWKVNADKHLSVVLGCQYEDDMGEMVDDLSLRSSAPIAIVPNLEYYLSIDIPKFPYLTGRKIEIGLLQEGVVWWENKVTLNK